MNFKAMRSTPLREEKAFADDVAAGPLGGFIWPPRSYSCSFCGKKFKSAQALGGHMNVHRRDRARLRRYQNEDVLINHQNHIHKYPPQVLFKLDTDLGTNATIASTDHSPSRVSTVSTQENFNKRTHGFVEEQPKAFFPSSPPSRSDSEAVMLLRGRLDSKARSEKSPRKEDSTFLGVEDCVETNLSVGLNLVIPRNQPSMPLVHKLGSNDQRYPFQREALVEIFKSSSILEDIDLELRLGAPPN